MTKEHGKTAAAVPPGDEFKRAIEHYLQCVRDRTESLEAFEKAQAAYFAAANALPLPTLMQGPVVIVTDADSLEKARTVLEMTTVGIDAELRITERIVELIDYRNAKAGLAKEHNLDELGGAALLGASMVQRALGELVRIIGHDDPDTWEQAVASYRIAWSGWDILGTDYTNAEADALSDLWTEYRDRLVNFPAPTTATLLEKMRIVFGELDNSDELLVEDAKVLLADAERLLGEEAR